MLYANICGLTRQATGDNPADIISILSLLFTNFDFLCINNEIYKVRTIGDCYVAICFNTEQSEAEQQKTTVANIEKMLEVANSMI